MWAVLAFTICTAILAIGDILAVKTKAVLSMMFVGGLIFLVGFAFLGFPKDLIVASGANSIYSMTVGLCMVNMGASIPLQEMKKQWKTVVTGFSAAAFIGIFCTLIGPLFIERNLAFIGAPVVAGGIGAMNAVLAPINAAGGNVTYSVFCVVIIMIQYFIGIPIASSLLKKEAKKVMLSGEINNYRQIMQEEGTQRKKLIPPLPKKYESSQIFLLKGGIVVSLGYFLNSVFGGWAPTMLVCLLLGLLFQELGFLEKGFLDKSNSTGFVLMTMTFSIFASMADATPSLILEMLRPLIVLFLLGLIGIFVSALFTSKALKKGYWMCVAIGLSGLFGFPPTMTISKEVSRAMSTNDDDYQALENYIMPQMVIGGFSVFTIGSVILGSILSRFIVI